MKRMSAFTEQTADAIAARAIIDNVAASLGQLAGDIRAEKGATFENRGSRSADAHLLFEGILAAAVPADAKERHLINALSRALKLHHNQVSRGVKRKQDIEMSVGNGLSLGTAFSAGIRADVKRQRRWDFRGRGREVQHQLITLMTESHNYTMLQRRLQLSGGIATAG